MTAIDAEMTDLVARKLPPRETLNPAQVWKFLAYPGRAAERLYGKYGALAPIGFFGAKYTMVLTPEAALQVFAQPPEDYIAFYEESFGGLNGAGSLWILAGEAHRRERKLFAPAVHRHLMAFPGMRERTVKIGSAGKMFALTGWKVGFLCAAPPLTEVLAKAHQFLTFTTPPGLQAAVAWGLANSDAWFAAMPATLAASRDRLTEGLRREGFAVIHSQATYFLNVDLPASGVFEDDMGFCLRAVNEAGVAAIPVSAFYEEAPVTSIMRLCFAKKDATLDEGVRRLAAARELSVRAHNSARG